jgi:hypothetical protein
LKDTKRKRPPRSAERKYQNEKETPLLTLARTILCWNLQRESRLAPYFGLDKNDNEADIILSTASSPIPSIGLAITGLPTERAARSPEVPRQPAASLAESQSHLPRIPTPKFNVKWHVVPVNTNRILGKMQARLPLAHTRLYRVRLGNL